MQSNLNTSGFTLTEMLIALTIIAIAVSALTVNWSPQLDRAALAEAVQAYVNFDRATRLHAIDKGRTCLLKHDSAHNSVSASRWNGNIEFFQKLQLGPRTQVTNVLFTAEAISVSPSGSSTSYAVAITGNSDTKWIYLIGGTGQAKVFDKLNDVKAFHDSIEGIR